MNLCQQCDGEGYSDPIEGAICPWCEGLGFWEERDYDGCPGCGCDNCFGECYEEQAAYYEDQATTEQERCDE